MGADTDLKMHKGKKGYLLRRAQYADGEAFSPIEDSAEGYIYYEMPAIYQTYRYWFRNGKVVEASADKNEAFLLQMLDTDKGARFLGELGVG